MCVCCRKKYKLNRFFLTRRWRQTQVICMKPRQKQIAKIIIWLSFSSKITEKGPAVRYCGKTRALEGIDHWCHTIVGTRHIGKKPPNPSSSTWFIHSCTVTFVFILSSYEPASVEFWNRIVRIPVGGWWCHKCVEVGGRTSYSNTQNSTRYILEGYSGGLFLVSW